MTPRAGAYELPLKPTSPQALRDRLTSIVYNSRPMVKLGEYYVPRRRRQPTNLEPVKTA